MNLLPSLLRPASASARATSLRSPSAEAVSASSTEDETAQRLQVGLIGLGAMVLLVGVADMIMARAQQSENNAVPEAAAAVAPSPSPSGDNSALETAGVVPDLPMDVSGDPVPEGPVLPEQARTAEQSAQ